MEESWRRGKDDDPVVSDETFNEEQRAAIRSWLRNLGVLELAVFLMLFGLYVQLVSRSQAVGWEQFQEGFSALVDFAGSLSQGGAGPGAYSFDALAVLATLAVAVVVSMASAQSGIERAYERVRGVAEPRRKDVFAAQFAVMGGFGVVIAMLPVLTVAHLMVIGGFASAARSGDSESRTHLVASVFAALLLLFLLAECARLFSNTRSPAVLKRRGDGDRLAKRLKALCQKQPLPPRRITVRRTVWVVVIVGWGVLAFLAGSMAGAVVVAIGFGAILASAMCFAYSVNTAVIEIGFTRWLNLVMAFLMLIMGSVLIGLTMILAVGSINGDDLAGRFITAAAVVWVALVLLLIFELLGRAGIGYLSVLGLRSISIAALHTSVLERPWRKIWVRLALVLLIEVGLTFFLVVLPTRDAGWDTSLVLGGILILVGCSSIFASLKVREHFRFASDSLISEIRGRRFGYFVSGAVVVILLVLGLIASVLIPCSMNVGPASVLVAVVWWVIHFVVAVAVIHAALTWIPPGTTSTGHSASCPYSEPAEEVSRPRGLSAVAVEIAQPLITLGDLLLDHRAVSRRRYIGHTVTDDEPWGQARVRLALRATLSAGCAENGSGVVSPGAPSAPAPAAGPSVPVRRP